MRSYIIIRAFIQDFKWESTVLGRGGKMKISIRNTDFGQGIGLDRIFQSIFKHCMISLELETANYSIYLMDIAGVKA